MRWDDLFADLEAQLDAVDDGVWSADVAERARAERMSIHLVDRIRAHAGPVRLHLADASVLEAEVADCGPDWVLLDCSGPRRALQGGPPAAAQDVLVPLSGVVHLTGLGASALTAQGPVARRLSLDAVLRGLVRRRCTVELRCTGSARLTGTLDAVAADHVDLAAHAADRPRRPANVTAHHAVRTAAIVSVRVL